MKKIILLTLSILFIAGCEKKEIHDSNFKSINLMTEDNTSVFDKTVILFENNDYLIKTNFDNYINAYPYDVLYGYDGIKERANRDAENQDTLLMTNYLYHAKDSTNILAYHLGNGSCLIFDKKNEKIILSIEMEEWIDASAPLAGAGGRRFYIKNKLFLETIDWIS